MSDGLMDFCLAHRAGPDDEGREPGTLTESAECVVAAIYNMSDEHAPVDCEWVTLKCERLRSVEEGKT